MKQVYKAAAYSIQYSIFITSTKPERELVAAHAIQAVATAISTSPTYPIYITVVTMAESIALIYSEERYTRPPPGDRARHRLNALNAAVEAGMAAYAENNAWPADGDDLNGSDSQSWSDSNSDSGWTQIHMHPCVTQSSGGHSSPGR